MGDIAAGIFYHVGTGNGMNAVLHPLTKLNNQLIGKRPVA